MWTIYHNPRCSKSRQTLQLLQDKGVEPEVVLYLETPPDAATLRELLKKLGIDARELLRTGEDAYKELGLKDRDLAEDDLIRAMAEHPKLIQRPIVVKGERAVLGRPPENVLELL
ncbi:arsenate reductase (glutaredoxin) [Microbulbifer yueqingensis]|uniref:Arsenate reductase n=1 Tax=Microbulbifer yueqingensis TaxID=658219 RepID=A0A1G8V2I1_9GAMM|nr:arsenate reductase (glutaredoxin) [Microbulbifer yueqingensis]SDJ60067.1 arsenate reductase [Microbulbifer yueqingensis]